MPRKSRNEATPNDWRQALEKLQNEMATTPDVPQKESETVRPALESSSQKEREPVSPEEAQQAGRRDCETNAPLPRIIDAHTMKYGGQGSVDIKRWQADVEKRYGKGSWEKYHEGYTAAQEEQHEAWRATPEGLAAAQRIAEQNAQERKRDAWSPEQQTEGSFSKGRSPYSR